MSYLYLLRAILAQDQLPGLVCPGMLGTHRLYVEVPHMPLTCTGCTCPYDLHPFQLLHAHIPLSGSGPDQICATTRNCPHAWFVLDRSVG